MSNHPIFVPKFCIFLSFCWEGVFRFCSVGWDDKHFPLSHLYFRCWGKSCPSLWNRHSTHTELVCLSDDTFFTVCMHLNLLMLFSSISKILLFNSDAKIGSTRKREKTKERYINSDLERKKCSSSFPEENNNRFCSKKLIDFFPRAQSDGGRALW